MAVKRVKIAENERQHAEYGTVPHELTFLSEDDFYVLWENMVYYLPGHRPDFVDPNRHAGQSGTYPGCEFGYLRDDCL